MDYTKLKMVWFSDKYGLPLHKLSRYLDKFETVQVEGYARPWIVESPANIELAKFLIADRARKPKKARLTADEFCKKYEIDMERLKIRWTCLLKEEVDGKVYIAETRNNLRHAGVLKPIV